MHTLHVKKSTAYYLRHVALSSGFILIQMSSEVEEKGLLFSALDSAGAMKTYFGAKLQFHVCIELLGRTVGAPASYSKDSGFISHPEDE
jgi:hypothetical protein